MAKTIAPQTESPMNPTSVYIDLSSADVDELTAVKVGQNAKVVLIGKVAEISMRKDASNKDKTGSIRIEDPEVSIDKAPTDMSALADDEPD